MKSGISYKEKEVNNKGVYQVICPHFRLFNQNYTTHYMVIEQINHCQLLFNDLVAQLWLIPATYRLVISYTAGGRYIIWHSMYRQSMEVITAREKRGEW